MFTWIAIGYWDNTRRKSGLISPSTTVKLEVAMSREKFPCTHTLRVRWSEVDMQKIVFNGHYLDYIDVAVAEYWRAQNPSVRKNL